MGGPALRVLLGLVAAVVVRIYVRWAEAGGLLDGAGVGVVSFTSIAVTASLLGGRFTGEKLLLGVAVYFGRLLFVVVAVGVPILLGLWPVLPIICGFAGVYVVENILLLVGAWRARGAVGRGAPRA